MCQHQCCPHVITQKAGLCNLFTHEPLCNISPHQVMKNSMQQWTQSTLPLPLPLPQARATSTAWNCDVCAAKSLLCQVLASHRAKAPD